MVEFRADILLRLIILQEYALNNCQHVNSHWQMNMVCVVTANNKRNCYEKKCNNVIYKIWNE